MLTSLLLTGDIDYMQQSFNSSPSLDQPGHVSCVSTAMPMCTMDPRARHVINGAHVALLFNELPVSCDVRARILSSTCNDAYISIEGAQLKFR